MKVFDYIKIVVSAVWAWVLTALGGADDGLILLVMLICADILTGCLKAGKKKKLSSAEMRAGIVRKLLIFVIIAITVRIDIVLLHIIGEPIMIFGKAASIRILFICYCSLEELISILENASELGVPIPKWLRRILKVAYETASGESTPRFIVSWFKEKFGVDFDKRADNKDEGTADGYENASDKDDTK